MLKAATAVGVIIVVAGTLFFAAPARADQYEYVQALDEHGVYYSSILNVIDQGKMSCHILSMGQTTRAAMDSAVRAGYSTREAANIVVYAAKYMCPDQWARATEPGGSSHY